MENTPDKPLNLDELIKQKKGAVDKRVARTLANPFLLEKDRLEVDTLASLIKLTLETHNTLVLQFAKEFIKLTDQLMVSDDEEKRPPEPPEVPTIPEI